MVLAINWCRHLDHAGVRSAERCNVKLLVTIIPSQFKVASAPVTQLTGTRAALMTMTADKAQGYF